MDPGIGAGTWAALALMILFAKLGGEMALRVRQPAVLGELLVGMILGNVPIPGLSAVVALVGKSAASLGARGGDRLTVGLGMTPRGEVGLIFASVGSTLEVGGKPLLSAGVYAALVAAVFVTTLAAPPALAARIRARNRETSGGAGA